MCRRAILNPDHLFFVPEMEIEERDARISFVVSAAHCVGRDNNAGSTRADVILEGLKVICLSQVRVRAWASKRQCKRILDLVLGGL